MFCGRSERDVPFLPQGIDGFICSDCVELAHNYLEDALGGASNKEGKSLGRLDSLKKPVEIKEFLDELVTLFEVYICSLYVVTLDYRNSYTVSGGELIVFFCILVEHILVYFEV